MDKHIAHRNLHLVTPGARPLPPQGERYQQEPATFLLDFHNAGDEEATVDLVFDRALLPGHLSLMLPRLELADPRSSLVGFTVEHHDRHPVRILLGEWLEQAGELIE